VGFCQDTHDTQSIADQRHSSRLLTAFDAITLMCGVKRAAKRSDNDERCLRFESKHSLCGMLKFSEETVYVVTILLGRNCDAWV
jgi:hypothetical protein